MWETCVVALIGVVSVASPSRALNPYLAQARVLYQSMDYENALARLKKAATWTATSDTEAAEIQLYTGLCNSQLGDLAAARAAFRLAIERDPAIVPPPLTSPKIDGLFKEELAAYSAAHPAKAPVVEAPPPESIRVPEPAEPKRVPDEGAAESALMRDLASPLPSSAPTAQASEVTHRVWPGAIAVAAAVVAGGCAAYLGIKARSQSSDAHNAEYASDARRLSDAAHSSATQANILYGIAGGAAAVGVALFVVF